MREANTLQKLGYKDHFEYHNRLLCVDAKGVRLDFASLFFVDAIYLSKGVYTIAISAPKYKLKGILQLNKEEFEKLKASEYKENFNVKIEKEPKEIIIRREYGLRKVLKSEFDPDRYILREGFPDFPPCPYGHHFRALGYDRHNQSYVRLAKGILKDDRLQKEIYKGVE